MRARGRADIPSRRERAISSFLVRRIGENYLAIALGTFVVARYFSASVRYSGLCKIKQRLHSPLLKSSL